MLEPIPTDPAGLYAWLDAHGYHEPTYRAAHTYGWPMPAPIYGTVRYRAVGRPPFRGADPEIRTGQVTGVLLVNQPERSRYLIVAPEGEAASYFAVDDTQRTKDWGGEPVGLQIVALDLGRVRPVSPIAELYLSLGRYDPERTRPIAWDHRDGHHAATPNPNCHDCQQEAPCTPATAT
jgi:hypothetical protein